MASLTTEQALAFKIHSIKCSCKRRPNGRQCKCGFVLKPKNAKEWFSNAQNLYFLRMARNTMKVMKERSIAEEDMCKYLEVASNKKAYEIPDKIRSVMHYHGLL